MPPSVAIVGSGYRLVMVEERDRVFVPFVRASFRVRTAVAVAPVSPVKSRRPRLPGAC